MVLVQEFDQSNFIHNFSCMQCNDENKEKTKKKKDAGSTKVQHNKYFMKTFLFKFQDDFILHVTELLPSSPKLLVS